MLIKLGVRGGALDRCCAAPGVTTIGVALEVLQLEAQKRLGRIETVTGVLVNRLTTEYQPPPLVKPEDLVAVSKTWPVASIRGHDVRGVGLKYGKDRVCWNVGDDMRGVPATELSPETIELEVS